MLPSACAPPLGSATDLRDAALATAGAEDKLQSDYVTFNGGTPLNVSLSTGPRRDADWRYWVAARQPPIGASLQTALSCAWACRGIMLLLCPGRQFKRGVHSSNRSWLVHSCNASPLPRVQYPKPVTSCTVNGQNFT